MNNFDINFDIDIDCADRSQVISLFNCVPASIVKDSKYTKHNTGVYFQDIPVSPLDGFSSIDHKQAEQQGWFKVDFLNNNIYKDVRDPAHLTQLINTDPMWELLQHDEVIEQLYHINNHADIVKAYNPSSILELAMILAIIRPAKKHLVGKSFSEIAKTVWEKPLDGEYYFKKAHAVAFATAIVVQLNLLCEQLN